jgi:hypothetical protein
MRWTASRPPLSVGIGSIVCSTGSRVKSRWAGGSRSKKRREIGRKGTGEGERKGLVRAFVGRLAAKEGGDAQRIGEGRAATVETARDKRGGMLGPVGAGERDRGRRPEGRSPRENGGRRVVGDAGPALVAGGCLPAQPAQGAQVDHEARDLDLLGTAGRARGGQPLEADGLDLGVARLGPVAPPVAGLPGPRAVRGLGQYTTDWASFHDEYRQLCQLDRHTPVRRRLPSSRDLRSGVIGPAARGRSYG